MLFEVLFDGKVRASTSYLECIPTKNTLPDMEHASDLFTCDRLTGSTAGKNMFYNCNSLVGGNGTKYADKLTQDKTMACIDKVNQPGYFTYKAAPNALSDDTTNLPAEVGEADISVIDNETISFRRASFP